MTKTKPIKQKQRADRQKKIKQRTKTRKEIQQKVN